MSNGSSPTFIIYGSASFGADGAAGPTGPTGPTGSTGDCLQGNTGYGITGIGIRGDDLGITFGSGNTLTLILNDVAFPRVVPVGPFIEAFNIRVKVFPEPNVIPKSSPRIPMPVIP